MVPLCLEQWCTEANEATQTHCYNPVVPAYPVWAYYAHGRQRRCQQDPVSLPSGGLEKTTRSSVHHVAQHRPTGSETTPPYVPRSSRLGSEPPSVEDNVDMWRYAILELHARNGDNHFGLTDQRHNVSMCQFMSFTKLVNMIFWKKINPFLMQIGTSGLLAKNMKRWTFLVKGEGHGRPKLDLETWWS